MNNVFTHTVFIDATPATVWQAITDPIHMLQWMGDDSMNLQIHTNWMPGTEIKITGTHHQPFENKGMVLECVPEQQLTYTQLSSISCLPDEPENYNRINFSISSEDEQTMLQLQISNFPTESIQKHLEFYWRTTMVKIKKYAEDRL